ncbi:MAG: YbaN family protein [bacterium]|nr:YbaN family protein [bacterium]
MSNKIKKLVYLVLAFICVGIGAIGAVLPVLPTTPFLLLAVVLFERGSDRFHKWFMSTSLYKKHLEEFVRTKSMTLKKKLTILLPVSALMLLVFFTVPSSHAKIAIIVAIILKYYYFFFHIRTIK